MLGWLHFTFCEIEFINAMSRTQDTNPQLVLISAPSLPFTFCYVFLFSTLLIILGINYLVTVDTIPQLVDFAVYFLQTVSLQQL